MVNLYRFCIAILFVSLSSVIAQENCRIEQVQLPFDSDAAKQCHIDTMGKGVEYLGIDSDGRVWFNGFDGKNYKKTENGACRQYPKYEEKEICIDPKPDLSDWNNCKKGKDHGFSWIIIGDGNGEGESRFKQEFWACDDPDFWETYNHPPEPVPTDPDPKPTDPDNPDPKPTDPDGEGGEGGDNGSGNGNDGGSDGGNDNGSNNGGDQNGTGLTKSEVQEAVEGALDSKGQELEGKINKWWLATQSEMNREGTTMGHDADSMLDSAFAGMIIKRDINDFEREYRFQINAPKACPAPIVIEFIGFQATVPFDLICQFSEMIGYLVLASAYMSAIYIIMGLRRA